MSAKNDKTARRVVAKNRKRLAVQMVRELYDMPLKNRIIFAVRLIFKK